MPRNQFERMMFALMTVIVTVHAYVFYSLYVVNGSTLMNVTGENSVLGAVNAMGGVYMFGRNLPIWAVVITEFILAYTLEVTVGSPMSFKLACKVFDPKETHPVLFETAIICATVGIMCPAMSFLAAFLQLSLLCRIQHLYVPCQLDQTRMFQFPVCILLAAFLYPAFYQNMLQGGIQKKSRNSSGCKSIIFVQNSLCFISLKSDIIE